jgi:hypothetical protein
MGTLRKLKSSDYPECFGNSTDAYACVNCEYVFECDKKKEFKYKAQRHETHEARSKFWDVFKKEA